MTKRRYLIAILATAAALLIGYGIYWFTVAGLIRDGVADWAEARRADGYEVTHGAIAIDGFPWRFLVTLEQPEIVRPAAWRWSAPRLAAETRPFALDRVTVTLPRSQRLNYARRGEDRAITVALERGVALVSLADGDLERLTFEAGGVSAETPRGPVALAGLTGLVRRSDDAMIEVSIDGRDITLTPEAGGLLGREIAALGVTALTSADAATGSLTEWREAGGTVEVTRLALEWGAVKLDAEGTLALDGELRPEAAFSAELAGYGELLDILAAQGQMKSRDASFAKTFLNLMAKKQSGRRVLKAPISAQNGTLFIGPIPLLKLTPVTAW